MSAHDESDEDPPVDLMVTSRPRRANAGNRMSTLLAKSADDDEVWGDEWDEVAGEDDFVGGDANELDDYNMDSSSSEEDDDAAAADDDAGEKDLRRAERQERIKKRKPATNPFAARLSTAARKRVKLDPAHSTSATPTQQLRPKKKSERASWIPTDEDGPIRTSSRRQTVANKEHTMAKLKEKDRRRDDTLAMMKAAEARKAKDEPKPMTQAERLTEAARQERINKKTLHRWEEAEEARAAERQAKIDALKNRQIDGPFIRYYSGPAIYVDDKLKYTGKDAPSVAELEDKFNRELLAAQSQPAPSESEDQTAATTAEHPTAEHSTADTPRDQSQPPAGTSYTSPAPAAEPAQHQSSQLPWTPASQATGGNVFMGGDVFMGSSMSYPSNIMFAPPQNQESFLYGIDQYAQNQQPQPASTTTELPPNPFSQAQSHQPFTTPQPPFPPPNASTDDPLLAQNGGSNIGPQALLSQFQKPPTPPAPLRRKLVRRALRNLLILSSFPNLDAPPSTSRARTAASLTKDKDRTALIHLSTTLFNWSLADATAFVNNTLAASAAKTKKALAEREAALKSKKELCAVTNAVARYRDPETGIAYRDARAFGVLRGVVGGGFVWSGDLGCYVGGRAKPLESMGGKGFLGMPPAAGVPRRFLEMQSKMAPPAAVSGEPQGQSQAPTQAQNPTTAPTPAPAPPPAGSTTATDAPPALPAQPAQPGTAVKNEAVS